MSEKPSWLPTDESLLAAASNAALYWTCKEDDPAADLRDLIEQAVEKALVERGCARGQNTTQFCAEAVDLQRKLAEQEARHKRELVEARIDTLDDLWHATKRDDAGRTVEAAFASHVTPDFIREEVARLASAIAALNSEAK